MHKIILFLKEFRIYKKKDLLTAASSFSDKQFIIFLILLFVSLVSAISIIAKINSKFLVEVPTKGGSITEGIVGFPTLINPVIAFSDADKDLTSLIYSGLMRKTGEGEFIPDLAESFTVSSDGTIYTFSIREDAKFHNGKKVTADDIIFTIEKIKDPLVKSPKKSSWDGVEVTKKDELVVEFKLAKPYISFMDNTTTGILPSLVWKNINIKEFNLTLYNTKPIGSGPYKVSRVVKNKDGFSQKYELSRFNNFTLGKPLIKRINIISYPNEKDLIKALLGGSVSQAGGISPENAKVLKGGFKINTATLPRMFGVFFNSNNNKIFADALVVKSLNKAIDRQEIVDRVLSGYGTPTSNPIPEKLLQPLEEDKFTSTTTEEVQEALEKAGWIKGEDGIRSKGGTTTQTITKKVNGKNVKQTVKSNSPLVRLSFSLTTGDTPELRQAASLIKDQLLKIGVEVDIKKVYETGQLNQVIRARDYEALFFGQIINHESDLYSFWHSSQKTDPGLNIGMYSNKKADSVLETIQKILPREDRMSKYENLAEEFKYSIPAFTIYSPQYLYVSSPNLNNFTLSNLTIPSDRFSSVYLWSADTDKIWKIFTKN